MARQILQYLPRETGRPHSRLDQSQLHLVTSPASLPISCLLAPVSTTATIFSCPEEAFAANTICISATASGIGSIVERRSAKHSRKCFISSTYIWLTSQVSG